LGCPFELIHNELGRSKIQIKLVASECPSRSAAWSHQREQDFRYGDKADDERDNGDGELLTDHLLLLSRRRASLCRLSADMITVTPHAIFKQVQTARAVLNDACLCEVVDDLWRHS
jgi:hypothetical protein